MVATARFVTFAALYLHQNPACRDRLRTDDGAYLNQFVTEVRRHTPFFPLVGGRVREPFEWRGERFEVGACLVLDLYATNHDLRLWDEPGQFRPERFAGRTLTPLDPIPQGAGDHATGHRCPGEGATVELLKLAMRLLAGEMRYDVPEQDLSVDLSRLPALPAARFVITNVRRTHAASEGAAIPVAAEAARH